MKPVVIGHRANSGRIVAWYRWLGLDWVEVDVYWDKDKGVVVGHPPGPVRRATLIGSFFARLDYMFFYRNPFYGRHVLAEWAKRLSFSKGVMVDVKLPIPFEELADVVEFLSKSYGFEILVSGNDHAYLAGLKGEYPWIKISISIPIRPLRVADLVASTGADAVSMLHIYIDPDVVEVLHSMGSLIAAWTVNDSATAVRMAGMGVDFLVSDRPDRILGAIRRDTGI